MQEVWLTIASQAPHAVKGPRKSQGQYTQGESKPGGEGVGSSQGPPNLHDSGVFYGPTLTKYSKGKGLTICHFMAMTDTFRDKKRAVPTAPS